MAAGDGAGRLGDLTVLRHARLGRALGALLLAGGVLGAASTFAVAPVSQASESGALCAEATYLQVQFGTVGDPFAYSEGLGCLPLRVRGRHRWRRSGRYAVVVSLVEARGHVLVRTVGQATVTPPG